MYVKPNPSFNSIRGGSLMNVPSDCGNPEKPHAYDPTCLCDGCNEKYHTRMSSDLYRMTGGL